MTTENVAPADDNLYTTSIPAKTNAGTYAVKYIEERIEVKLVIATFVGILLDRRFRSI